jgi:hypothetical protein
VYVRLESVLRSNPRSPRTMSGISRRPGNASALYRSGMDKVAVLVLIAVAAFVSSFVLTSVFAVRPLRRRWLSTSAGVPLADFAEKSFDRLEGQHDRMGQSLARAEWLSRLL